MDNNLTVFLLLLGMKVLRSVISLVLILQVFIGSVGFTLYTTKCMHTGVSETVLNDVDPGCLHACESHKDRPSAEEEEYHCCHHASTQKNEVEGDAIHKDGCCNTMFADIHLDVKQLDDDDRPVHKPQCSLILATLFTAIFSTQEETLTDKSEPSPPPEIRTGREITIQHAVWII